MKKIASFLLALLLLLPPALAARAGGSLALSLSREEGRVGDVVEVTLSAKNNPGIISLQAKLKFDETKLQLLSVKDGGILGEEIRHQEEKTSPYTLSWENYVVKENFTEDGVLCTLSFCILAGDVGEEIPLTLEVGDYGVMNYDLQDLARSLENGSVTIVEGSLIREREPRPAWVTILLIIVVFTGVAAVLIGIIILLSVLKKKRVK